MFKNSSPNNCQANKKRIRKKAQEKYQNHSKKKRKKSNYCRERYKNLSQVNICFKKLI